MKEMIKFLVVDDQAIIRISLSEKLSLLFEPSEIWQCDSGGQSLALLEKVDPDIIFMDISMPEMDGIETTRQILSRHPNHKIIAFSMNDNDEMVNKMLKAGAIGYLLKTDTPEDYQNAVKNVLAGKRYVSKNVKK